MEIVVWYLVLFPSVCQNLFERLFLRRQKRQHKIWELKIMAKAVARQKALRFTFIGPLRTLQITKGIYYELETTCPYHNEASRAGPCPD